MSGNARIEPHSRFAQTAMKTEGFANPAPPGWLRMTTALYCDDAREAIAWYQRAFGFTVQIVVDGPDGGVAHSELRYGEAIVMVADDSADRDVRFGLTAAARARWAA
jgi:hypothetical protein